MNEYARRRATRTVPPSAHGARAYEYDGRPLHVEDIPAVMRSDDEARKLYRAMVARQERGDY